MAPNSSKLTQLSNCLVLESIESIDHTVPCTRTVLSRNGFGVIRVDLFPNGIEAAHVHDATFPWLQNEHVCRLCSTLCMPLSSGSSFDLRKRRPKHFKTNTKKRKRKESINHNSCAGHHHVLRQLRFVQPPISVQVRRVEDPIRRVLRFEETQALPKAWCLGAFRFEAKLMRWFWLDQKESREYPKEMLQGSLK